METAIKINGFEVREEDNSYLPPVEVVPPSILGFHNFPGMATYISAIGAPAYCKFREVLETKAANEDSYAGNANSTRPDGEILGGPQDNYCADSKNSSGGANVGAAKPPPPKM